MEQTSTYIPKQAQPEVIAKIDEPGFDQVTPFALVNRHFEEISEVAKRILVHRVDVGKVADCKEEQTALLSHTDVFSPCFVNQYLSLFC